jgi:hypothetical protein
MALVGLHVLLGASGYLIHAGTGRALGVLVVAVGMTGLAARVDRRQLALVGAIILAAGLQVAMVMAGRAGIAPALALHPAVGGLALAVAAIAAARADDLVVAARPARPETIHAGAMPVAG